MTTFFLCRPTPKSSLIDCNGNQDIIGCDSNSGNTNQMWFTISPNGETYSNCDGLMYKLEYESLYPGGKCYLWQQLILTSIFDKS